MNFGPSFLDPSTGFRLEPQKSALLALFFLPLYETMEVPGSFSLVFVNPAPEKQFANLGQTSAFLLSDLR